MGSDTVHDADTLHIHRDAREQHIHLAAVKAALLAAREFDAAAAKGSPALLPPACHASHTFVSSAAPSVGQRKLCRCGGCSDSSCQGREWGAI